MKYHFVYRLRQVSQRGLVGGDVWCVLNQRWWVAWKEFVNFDGAPEPPEVFFLSFLVCKPGDTYVLPIDSTYLASIVSSRRWCADVVVLMHVLLGAARGASGFPHTPPCRVDRRTRPSGMQPASHRFFLLSFLPSSPISIYHSVIFFIFWGGLRFFTFDLYCSRDTLSRQMDTCLV
jgi:hypothetical protein